MNAEERDQRRAAMKAKRMAEDQRAGTRYVMRNGEAWLAMQVNVPVEELRVDRGWGEDRVAVVRNSVAAYAERLLETVTRLVRVLEDGRGDEPDLAVAMARDLLEDLPEPLWNGNG